MGKIEGIGKNLDIKTEKKMKLYLSCFALVLKFCFKFCFRIKWGVTKMSASSSPNLRKYKLGIMLTKLDTDQRWI